MDNEYQNLISAALRAALGRAPSSFEELLAHMPGFWPGQVVNALGEMAAERHPLGELASAVAVDAVRRDRLVYTSRDSLAQELPAEHPLDFEWRFSPDAVERLWREYSESGATPLAPASKDVADSDVVLLGVPSVLWSAYQRGAGTNCVLLDSNPTVIRWFSNRGMANAILCDLGGESIPRFRAGFVVVDPPWYLDHYRAFLWAARECCKGGGRVAVSLPPLGTRPGIESERGQILSIAQQVGFEVESVAPGALPYCSPFFEANALRAAGLTGTPVNWRRGDLLMLRAVGPNTMPYRRLLFNGASFEASLGESRWRVEHRASASPAPEEEIGGRSGPGLLATVVEGDVLQTVSTRDARRHHANVWTSGNRIFHCERTDILIQILQSMAAERWDEFFDSAPHLGLFASEADLILRTSQLEEQEMLGVGYLRR